MLSYWEREYFLNAPDFVVLGSGIVGLSTAYFIKSKFPNKEVVVLERGFLPDGASTKNAGFCCFGSVTELADDLSKWPADQVFALAEKRFKGLQLLTQILGEEHMGYEPFGGYEIFTEKNEFERYFEDAQKLNTVFNSTIGPNVYTNASNQITDFGLGKVSGMIKNNYEGQVKTGLMMQSFLTKVKARGVKLFYGIEVMRFEQLNNEVELQTNRGFSFKTSNFIITTNGFAKQLLPELDVQPARAQVLITEPIEGLKLKGSFHYEQGYYYFRNVGDRVLFGGGRNLDFKTENTYEEGLTDLVQQKLDEILHDVILPYTTPKIDMRWSGIMGVGSEKKTIVKPLSQNVFCGVRMGGMGVALGSLIGKEISDFF
jgi:glycine/D-amino acid oxidase-like deaminating enzyme